MPGHDWRSVSSLRERTSRQWYNNHPARDTPARVDRCAGTLFVVATPIGNLEDITLRALRVLREADLIAAEDTRRTARLLTHYGIPTPTVSFHEHNTRARLPQLIARLQPARTSRWSPTPERPAFPTRASSSSRRAASDGIAVDPVPGASAALAAAVGSGFPLNSVTFLGFPPVRAKARRAWFEALAEIQDTMVFFEAPHRIGRR